MYGDFRRACLNSLPGKWFSVESTSRLNHDARRDLYCASITHIQQRHKLSSRHIVCYLLRLIIMDYITRLLTLPISPALSAQIKASIVYFLRIQSVFIVFLLRLHSWVGCIKQTKPILRHFPNMCSPKIVHVNWIWPLYTFWFVHYNTAVGVMSSLTIFRGFHLTRWQHHDGSTEVKGKHEKKAPIQNDGWAVSSIVWIF